MSGQRAKFSIYWWQQGVHWWSHRCIGPHRATTPRFSVLRPNSPKCESSGILLAGSQFNEIRKKFWRSFLAKNALSVANTLLLRLVCRCFELLLRRWRASEFSLALHWELPFQFSSLEHIKVERCGEVLNSKAPFSVDQEALELGIPKFVMFFGLWNSFLDPYLSKGGPFGPQS